MIKNSSKIPPFISLFSWALYDWAGSAFFSLIQTFLFAPYFIRHVARSEIEGSTQWGMTLGIAGILIALGGPILGSIADHSGSRKSWMGLFYLLCLVSTALLWYVKPEPSYIPLALLLISLGTIGSEFAFIFYNAMLPDLTTKKNVGIWSGIGWGMGYVGGMLCLMIALQAFINDKAWFALDGNQAESIRACFLLAAIWYGIFSLPIFMFTHVPIRKNESISKAVYSGIAQLKESLIKIKYYKSLAWFLAARMIYTDGLTSLFLFGGIYAAAVFQMSPRDILIFAIALNISAGIGAFVFSWCDFVWGSRKVIIVSLICLIFTTTIILLTKSLIVFWIFALLLGIFVGPLQSSSRAYWAKEIPEDRQNQMFGLFAFSGKATGFVGPILISLITHLTSSQRWGMSVIIPFFILGLFLMFKVRSEKA